MTHLTHLTQALAIAAITLSVSCLSSAAQRLGFREEAASQVGIMITDLKTGQETVNINSGKALLPASILKSVTAATALLQNGSDYRYTTECLYTGKITDGSLDGDILVIGEGDPTIAHPEFPETQGFIDTLASSISRMGIRHISGRVKVPDEVLADYGVVPQWAVEDVGWDYGAGLYPVNYAANSMEVNPYLGVCVSDMPVGDIVVESFVTDDDDTEIIHGVNSNSYIFTGKKLSNPAYTETTTMPSPTATVAAMLENACRSKGITIDNGNTFSTDTTAITRWKSPRAAGILETMMHLSDNLIAEATLRSIAPGKRRSDALRLEKELWDSLGVKTSTARITDGSGVSRTNYVTPRFMTGVLRHMALSDKRDEYVSLFPVAGREGTVKNFLKGTRLAGRIALKTGSMSGVQCYAGYKLDAKGNPTHTVVIMINNFFCKRAEIRNAVKTFLLKQFQ